MTDKQIMIDGVDISECNFCDGKSSDIPQCRIRLASFETTCKGYNCYYKQLKRLELKLKVTEADYEASEQECDELKKTINEAKNSKLDLKSFLVGEAVQDEYEYLIDTLKAENNTLFKAIEEVNKINKKLKAENEKYKKAYEIEHNNCNTLAKAYNEEAIARLNLKKKVKNKNLKKENDKLKQTLAEIKEIAEKRNYLDYNECLDDILQKISECEVENET